MDPLISTDWLAAHLKEVRIVDASLFLPEHRRDARDEFAAAHIPGAVFMDLASIRNPDSDLPSMLPPAAVFAERMGALGIAQNDPVVVYDDSPLHSAARAWWMLRRMGARNVAILDGGLARWRDEGRELTADGGDATATTFVAAPDLTRVADLAGVQQALAAGEQVVDARSATRFAGAEPEPRAGVVPGHMPGARNLHYARLFEADGRWKQGEALAAAFAEAGVDINRPVVTTCGSGITAAVLVFGLHLLGRDARLYDGSWSEWGAHPDTAKATGA